MNKSTRPIMAVIIAAAVLVAVGAAGGYAWARSRDGNSNASTVATVAMRASTNGHNQADIMFAQRMLPHHRKALDMAKQATTRASSALSSPWLPRSKPRSSRRSTR
jgi:uncharacterized protein (DUF305 family)